MNKIIALTRTTCLVFLFLFAIACKKDNENIIENNVAPAYSNIPTIGVENYVNRLFIDLIGREPVETELDLYVEFLKSNSLSEASRDTLIRYLQTNDDLRIIQAVNGKEYTDSYEFAYATWLYEKVKSRFFIELGKDEDFHGMVSFVLKEAGVADTTDPELDGFSKIKIEKLYGVVASRFEFLNGEIGIGDMMERMINNANYDEINMQNINWVRACFNDLFYRIIYSELNNEYALSLNNNELNYVFGRPFTNKDEFAHILTHSWEFYDGLATWLYITYLQRKPTTTEALQVIETLNQDAKIGNFQKMQRKLMVTDEYAQFKVSF